MRPSLRTAAVGVVLAAAAVTLLLQAACASPGPRVEGLPDRVDFNFHVKPILSDRCFACHGPDDRARKAELRLDVQDIALSRLPSGRRAIVPGRARRSELVRRILSTDAKVRMPAPESHLTLSDHEKALLIRWIDQGAEWKPHWSFIPPAQPALPAVRNTSWARTDIDRFVLAAMEARGLEPSPEASRETFIRRATFDLTGLPPTLAEIDAFLADASDEAHERVVDRLLASPAYGERMAADWLDVARYADSHGYQDDGMRQMWPWRDWVIDAFNEGLRFDAFITWQLAGDLLSEPTREQLIATGFNRHHMQSQEGGIVPEEYRTEYVADRVNTLGRAFLGVSVECARCHDHKYDPITQKEFYELFAFFNNVNEAGQIPYSGVPSPTVIVTDDESEAKLAALDERIRALEAELSVEDPSWDAGFDAWHAREAARAATDITRIPGLIAHLPLDASARTKESPPADPKTGKRPEPREVIVFANAANAKQRGRLGGDRDRAPGTVPGKIGNAQRLAGDSHIEVGNELGMFERHEPFSFALWVRIDEKGAEGPLVTRSGGVFNGNRGYEVILRADGTFTAGLHHVAPDNSIEVETRQPLEIGAWRHLAFTYDGSSRAAGLRLFIDGRPADVRVVVDNLRRSILFAQKGENWGEHPGLRIGRRHDETLQDVSVDDLRVYDRQLSRLEVSALAGSADPSGGVRAAGTAQRSAADGAALREHYLLRVDPRFARTSAAVRALRREQNELLTSLTEVMAMRELPAPRPTFVLARGSYDAPAERVSPDVPRVMGPLPDDLPKNRLGLAAWLVDPAHPLTARVIVNRYWAMLFGRGLVPSLADFGNQGRLPTHPDLLDYLASTFVGSEWDLKALQKQIVLSATYRQSSAASPALLERDPGNEWLARGASYRLSAEQIRDAALAVSGLLVRRIGGPSVYPYQPPGLWEALATRNATTYEQGKGDDLYRRSLYTVWKRSSPPPSAMTFDAADRLFCIVDRQRTNTPLQALVLLNDPQYLEAARVLAERMVHEGGDAPRDRLTFGFRLVTSRRPGAAELDALEKLYEAERGTFGRDGAAAVKLLSVGERPRDKRLEPAEAAAYAVAASTLLSLDEAVTRR